MEAAFAPATEKYRAEVLGATFGHLAPRPQEKYSGEIVFTHAEYGDSVVIRSTIEIDDSPWFYEDLHDFVAQDRICRVKIENGSVYRFVGTYTKFKNGNCRFSGKVEKVF